MKRDFKIIGFDADDTLWVNEANYRETEKRFFELFSDSSTADAISEELFKTELSNLDLYGYGAKGFVLSMIETALRISDNKIPPSTIERVIELGKDLLNKPVVLLDGVEEVLETLRRNGRKLIIATKGDLLDQQRKLEKSNLERFFHHVEIMSEKRESDYRKLLSHLDIEPEDFLMIGNSLRSDIIPVLNIGGYSIHVPCHLTWQHETVAKVDNHKNLREVNHLSEVLAILEVH